MNNQEKLAKIKTIVEDYFQDEYFPIDLESIRIIQKIEKLMRSLSTETLDEIPTTTHINTTMGFIGDEEIQFWSNFEVEDPEDQQIVEEIYELVKEAYEVMNP